MMGASHVNLQQPQALPKYATDTYIKPANSTYLQMFRKQRNTAPIENSPRLYSNQQPPPVMRTPGKYRKNLAASERNRDYDRSYNYVTFEHNGNSFQPVFEPKPVKRNSNNSLSKNKSSIVNHTQPRQTKAPVYNKYKKTHIQRDFLNDLNIDLKEITDYKIPNEDYIGTFINDLEPNNDYADMEGDHIFLDYTQEKSSNFNNRPNLKSTPIGNEGGHSFRSLPLDEIDGNLLTENEYLKKKIQLLQMENSNMHTKIQKLQRKLITKIDEEVPSKRK